MKKQLTAVITLLTAIVLTSCELRPLVDISNKLRIEVTIDTDDVSNVTSDIYNPRLERPSVTTDMVRCLFYDSKTGELVAQHFISEKSINEKGQEVISGTVDIIPGEYDLVCYNFDMPNTLIKDENRFYGITAWTNEVSTAIDKNFRDLENPVPGGTPINYDPDHLMVSRDPGLVIIPHADTQLIQTTATTCIDTYYFQIGIKGGKNVSSVSAVIDGMSSGNQFAQDIRLEESSCGVFFDLVNDIDEKKPEGSQDVLCGLFSTFGKIEDISSTARIIFTLTTMDGTIYEKSVSLEDVFKTEDAIERHWLLLDDEIVIPDPPEPSHGGGFDPKVEEWQEEEGTIVL